MKKLEELTAKLEGKIAFAEVTNPLISEASVGWHIEHSLLTLNSIIDSLHNSNPDDYKRTFDIRRSFVMLAGRFPRGRIQAPGAVRPAPEFNSVTLHQHIHRTRENLKALEQLPGGHYFKHPFLGNFKLRAARQFMAVHTNHHLRIIDDIIRSKNKTSLPNGR